MDEEKKVCQDCGLEVESQEKLDQHRAEVHGQGPAGGEGGEGGGGEMPMPEGPEEEDEPGRGGMM